MGPLEALLGEQPLDAVGVVGDAELGAGLVGGRFAEAGEVHVEHLALALDQLDDGLPGGAPAAEAMQQDERLSRPPPDVGQLPHPSELSWCRGAARASAAPAACRAARFDG